MNNVLFTPKAYQEPSHNPEAHSAPRIQKTDKIGKTLLNTMRYLVVGLVFLLPLFFVPPLYATLGFDKVMLTMVFGLIITILASLSLLRFDKVTTVIPLPLQIFGLFTVAAFLSALLSGDIQDAIRGNVFEVQTAGFIGLMLLTMIVPLLLQRSKIMSLTALIAFASSAGLVILYNIVRVLFGADFLTLGSFRSLTVSPVGGFNDLAVFSSLVVVLGLITLLQLPLKRWMQGTIAALVVAATVLLAVVNFFFLWVIVGFFALLFLIYILSRDTLFKKEDTTVAQETADISPLLIFVTLFVCLVSVLFVVAGDFMGARISQITEVNYIEVRPSMSATIDMGKAVYQDDVLLGSGPNRFADVWRLNKEQSINNTNFWNVDFVSGFGFIPTLFVTLGILGGLLMVAFHGSYLYLAYKMLLKTDSDDSFWYYVGTASFVATLMLWMITYVYAPGATVLLLTALFTGMTFVAYQALVPSAAVSIPLATTRRRGFFLMAIAVVLVVLSVMILFSVGKQYIAQVNFSKTQATATTIEEFELGMQYSYETYQDNRFLESLAQAKLVTLGQLLTVQDPTEADQEKFAATAQQVILFAQEASRLDPTSPDPHIILTNVYYTLSQAGLEGAKEQALASLEDARWRDPFDPSYDLQAAYIAAQAGDLEAARTNAQAALALKQNYGEVLFLLAQIDIQEGDVESAIATTQQLITFEPNNPTRFYQLGILLAANSQFDEAIEAYQAALLRDQEFANARYMLALTLVELGKRDEALTQLRIVQESNQDNQELAQLIARIEAGEDVTTNVGLETPVDETDPNQTTEDGVVSTTDTDTNLVTPVNTPAAVTESDPAAEAGGGNPQ